MKNETAMVGMANKPVNWDLLKNEYIIDKLSYRQLSEKHNIPYKTVAYNGKQYDWVGSRNQYWEKHGREVQEQVINSDVDEILQVKEEERKDFEKIKQVIWRSVFEKEVDEGNKKEQWKIKDKLIPQDARNFVGSMAQLQAMIYKSYGIADKMEHELSGKNGKDLAASLKIDIEDIKSMADELDEMDI